MTLFKYLSWGVIGFGRTTRDAGLVACSGPAPAWGSGGTGNRTELYGKGVKESRATACLHSTRWAGLCPFPHIETKASPAGLSVGLMAFFLKKQRFY